MNKRQKEIQVRIQAILRKGDADLSARFVGNNLDNSDGEGINPTAIRLGIQELVVVVNRNGQEFESEAFNLLDVLQIAGGL